MDWADYLLWRTDAAFEPLVHAHVHLISSQVWADFAAIDRGLPESLQLAARCHLDHLVLSRRRNPDLVRLVAETRQYRVLYQDRQSLLVTDAADAPSPR
jgi:hypothetical protein